MCFGSPRRTQCTTIKPSPPVHVQQLKCLQFKTLVTETAMYSSRSTKRFGHSLEDFRPLIPAPVWSKWFFSWFIIVIETFTFIFFCSLRLGSINKNTNRWMICFICYSKKKLHFLTLESKAKVNLTSSIVFLYMDPYLSGQSDFEVWVSITIVKWKFILTKQGSIWVTKKPDISWPKRLINRELYMTVSITREFGPSVSWKNLKIFR